MDKELREKITKPIVLLLKKSHCPYSKGDFQVCLSQILALIKETEEADLVAHLLDRGWMPPEEAKDYVRLASDRNSPASYYWTPTGKLEICFWREMNLQEREIAQLIYKTVPAGATCPRCEHDIEPKEETKPIPPKSRKYIGTPYKPLQDRGNVSINVQNSTLRDLDCPYRESVTCQEGGFCQDCQICLDWHKSISEGVKKR